MLPATSDRVRVDRKFNCVTRQRLIHDLPSLLSLAW